MKRLTLWLPAALVLAGILAACAGATVLRFSNDSQCGTATISLTNTQTGNVKEYTVAQGKALSINMEPGVQYHYEVDYERLPGGLQCDSKRVTTELSKGKTLNVSLQSTVDPSLQPTATPAQ